MTTVSVSKREGLSAIFRRDFDDFSEAKRFVESWLPMHVQIHDESGKPIDVHTFLRGKEPALLPLADDDGALCSYCGAAEAPIFADDECLHACASCDRSWYVDEDGNALAADRCPACESEQVTVFEDGRRSCGACGHKFFFDGLTFVDPATIQAERDGESC